MEPCLEKLVDVRADLSDEIDPDLLFDRGLRWLPGREHLPEWSFVWQWLMASGWGERDREALFERLWVWLEVPDNQRQETWDKLFESGLDAGCEGPEFLRLGAAWILMQPQALHLRVLAVKILAAAPAKALFMTVWWPSTRSAEKSCGIRQG